MVTAQQAPEAFLLQSIQTSEGQQFEASGIFLPFNLQDSVEAFLTTFNAAAGKTIGTDLVQEDNPLGPNVNGEDMVISLFDAGRVINHQELVNRILQVDGALSSSSHSCHVACTIIGMGIVPEAKGMAPQARIRAFDWNNNLEEIELEALRGSIISNHSYGILTGWSKLNDVFFWWGDPAIDSSRDYLFGFYSQEARNFDAISHRYPHHLIVKAAGNDRQEMGPAPGMPHYVRQNNQWTLSTDFRLPDGPYFSVSHSACSKNVLTVGAVHDLVNGYSFPSSVLLASFSSSGPTADGRIKPDITGNGVALFSASSASPIDYKSKSGSSMATASVTGSITLLQQFYYSIYNRFMLAATVKALVIHTAHEAGLYEGPDYDHGWGLFNTPGAYQVIAAAASPTDSIIENTLLNNQTVALPIHTDGEQALTATIAWTDVPGDIPAPAVNPSAPILVNDLDIRMIHVATGTTYLPYILDPAQPQNAATTGDNVIDNVEKIYIQNPLSGDYLLTISHKNTLEENQQDFALILSGLTSPEDCAMSVDFIASTSTPCINESLTFENATSNAVSYQWLVNQNLVSTSENLNFTFDESGIYTVTLIANDGQCVESSQQIFEVLPALDLQFNYGFDGLQLNINPNIQNDDWSYSWELGDGNTSDNIFVNHLFENPGVYQVCLQIENACTYVHCEQINVFPEDSCLRTQDSLALLALRESLNIETSTLYHWPLDLPIYLWDGIGMSDDSCRVEKIDLRNNDLIGTIAPEIGNLTGLRQLRLSGMKVLDHQIPDELWNLDRLFLLDLRNGDLEGEIPSGIGNLTELTDLYLSGNRFQGPIPAAFYNLVGLKRLSLANNQLSGSLSASIGLFVGLELFDLFNNQFSGPLPESFNNLIQLRYLALAQNDFVGPLPTNLYNMVHLTHLLLWDTFLSDSLTENIGQLTELEQLRLFNMPLLTGHIPNALAELNKLRFIHFANTNLTGTIPAGIGNLPFLKEFWINRTYISGQLPPFENALALEEVFADRGQLSGPIPTNIFQLPNMKTVRLDHNNFTFSDIEPIINQGLADSIALFTYSLQNAIPVFQSGDTLYVKAGAATEENTYAWYRNGVLQAEIAGDSTFIPNLPGLYYCRVSNASITQPLQWYSNLNLSSESINTNLCDTDCVWPGDINNDGLVDLLDFLSLPFGIGQTGPPRLDQSISWNGKSADIWGTTLNEYLTPGIDGKHADSNGDGMINLQDTLSICQNWGLSHNVGSGAPITPEQTQNISIQPHIAAFNVQGDGASMRLDIVLIKEPFESVRNIGCVVPLPFLKEADSVSILLNTDCFGEEVSSLVKYDQTNQKVNIGINSGTPAGINCDSIVIGSLNIIIEDVVPIDTNQLFSVIQPIIIRPNGQIITPIDAQTSLSVDFFTGLYDLTGAKDPIEVTLYPNPTRETLFIQSTPALAMPLDISIYNSQGNLLKVHSIHSFGDAIQVSELSPGVYFIRGKNKSQWFLQKFIKME
ncbi:MAG: hypothetical protein DHS20C18_50180 [Saprospiraceae bacterium]|nr:MAG: hypothetical protein DHS20C18_50180 [Saprospiraceae bacterium]